MPANDAAVDLQAAWRRPFRAHAGNHRPLAPVDQILTSGGLIFRDHHIWLNAASAKGASPTFSLLGLPAYRLAGYYSMANSEFSTLPFLVPSAPLWINADAKWVSLEHSSPTFAWCVCPIAIMIRIVRRHNITCVSC